MAAYDRGRRHARAQVLVGDVSPMNIVQSAEPYRVTYYLRAEPATLRQFAQTPPGHKIEFIATLRLGSRQLLIGPIESVDG